MAIIGTMTKITRPQIKRPKAKLCPRSPVTYITVSRPHNLPHLASSVMLAAKLRNGVSSGHRVLPQLD
jgi:hypothetical protein